MMRWNRLFACAITAVMIAGLGACGSKDETAEDTDQITAQEIEIATGDDTLEDESGEEGTDTSAKTTSASTDASGAKGTTVTTAVSGTSKGGSSGTTVTTKKNSSSTQKASNGAGNNTSNNTGGSAKTTAPKATNAPTTTTTTVYIAPEDVDKYVDFGAVSSGDGYTYDGAVLNISSPGTYHLTGTLNGMIYVNVGNEDKVKLRLNGVGITNTGAPCIQVDNADKVTVNVVSGSSNYLECYSTNADGDAALFSKDDLKIKGEGSLYVFCDNEHGIACNNDLEIEECQLTIDAEKTGISSHKSIVIYSGNIVTNGDNCGIRSWDYIEISGGFVASCGGKKAEADRGGIISDTGNFCINGGTVIAVGMNQTIPYGQTSACFSFPSVMTKDNSIGVSVAGMSIATVQPNKKFSCALISDPSLSVGSICDVWLNDVYYDNFTLVDTVTQAVLDGVV